MYYKSSKDNIVPDILLQLASTNIEKLSPMHNEHNFLLITNVNFMTTIVQMNDKLRK